VKKPSVLLLLLAGCEAGTVDLGPGLEIPGPPPPPCRLVRTLGPTQLTQSQDWETPGIKVDGPWVYVHRQDQTGAIHIYRIEARARLEQPIRQGVLIDARGGGVLIASPSGAAFDLSWRTVNGAIDLLGFPELEIPRIWGNYAAPPIRATEPGATVWHDLGRSETIRRIVQEDLVIGSGRPLFWPHVQDRRFAWSEFTGDGTVVRVVDQDRERRYPGAGIQTSLYPVLLGEKVLFLSGERAMILAWNEHDNQVLHPGPCGPPASAGRRAVFSCGSTGQAWSPAFGNTLLLYDADLGTVETLHSTRGSIGSARIADNVVAWIDYAAESGCGPPVGQAAGKVMIQNLDDPGTGPIEVAEVEAPCWCCDSIWPAGVVEVSGDAVAWNYARGGDGDAGRGERVGYAAIDVVEACVQN
jgi:hypothetical protein